MHTKNPSKVLDLEIGRVREQLDELLNLQSKRSELLGALESMDAGIIKGSNGSKTSGVKKESNGVEEHYGVRAARTTCLSRQGKQPPLRDAVFRELRRAHVPIRSPEIAKRVLKTGYLTEAKNFPNVVSTIMSTLVADGLVLHDEDGYSVE